MLVAVSSLSCVYAAGAMVLTGQPGGWAVATALFLFVGGIWLLGGTRYTLTDSDLRVRCRPLGWRVALAEIRSVTPTRNPLSSPAPSLDRLRIEYGNERSIMISPKNKQAFLHEMESQREAPVTGRRPTLRSDRNRSGPAKLGGQPQR